MSNQNDDSDPLTALQAALAAAEQGNFGGFDVFVRALTNDDWEVRATAAYYLGCIGFSAALGPLCHMAHADTMADNRAEAIYGLEGIGRPAGIPALIDALGDEEDLCRQAARTVLFRLIGPDAPITGDEGDELDAAEPEGMRQWWAMNSHRFDPGRVYALGRLAGPDVFIECCRTSVISLPDAYLCLLEEWTGQNFGQAPLADVVAKWEKWWRTNAAHYEPGRRYFHGHPVP